MPAFKKYATDAMVRIGSIGQKATARNVAAGRSAYKRATKAPLNVGIAGGQSGYGATAHTAAVAHATATRRGVAQNRARAAMQKASYDRGVRRTAVGGGVVGAGALTANPKSNQSRTASFGNGQRRPIGGGIQSPRGTGRYAG